MSNPSRPIRVVHVTCVHPATDSRIFEKECTSLAEAGYDVTLVATGTPPTRPGRVRIITRERFRRRLVRFVMGPLWAMWQALRQRPDIIHVHDPELLPLAMMVRWFGRVVIFDSHEDLPEQMGHKPYLPRPLALGTHLLSHALIRLVRLFRLAVVAATPHIAERFPGASLVQNFPRIEDWAVANRSESVSPFTLAYVGGITESRGLWQMVSAVEMLADRGHDVLLNLAGPISDDLKSRLDASQVEHTRYLGTLDRKGVASVLSSADAGLVLFDPSPNNMNGRPTKLFEYMAAGIPCVASDFPLWRAMVLEPKVGLLADPLDVEAIASAIEQIMLSPDAARAMGQRGRAWVEAHRNWASEAGALISLYEKLSTR